MSNFLNTHRVVLIGYLILSYGLAMSVKFNKVQQKYLTAKFSKMYDLVFEIQR